MHISPVSDKEIPGDGEPSYWKQMLARKVMDALVKYLGIDKDLLNICVKNNEIVLNGIIYTTEQKEEADDIVNILTKGNISVQNNLRIDVEYLDAEAFM